MAIRSVNFTKRKKNLVRLFVLIVFSLTVLTFLTQGVSAKNTYVITDGDSQTVHVTSTSDPGKVLSEAGVQLNEDDTYTTVSTDGVSQITVCRNKTVSVSYIGQEMTVETQQTTVGAFLQEIGVNREGLIISHADSDVLTDGMKIAISQVITAEETCSVETGFTVVTCQDDTLAAGTSRVLRPGTAKMVLRTDKVTYVNHQEFCRETLSEEVLDAGEKRVVLVGTGKNVGGERTSPIIQDGVIVLPDDRVLYYESSDEFRATAYTHTDDGCNMTTATGTTVHVGTVAVDPRVIKYGTKMFIISSDGTYVYGEGTAEDCGGVIKGHRIDVYYPTREECHAFNIRQCTVYFLQ